MVIILRGCIGSGKSRLASILASAGTQDGIYAGQAEEYVKSLRGSILNTEHNLFRASADDYFMVGNEYKFNPAMLGAAHGSCMRLFTDLVKDTGDTSNIRNVLVVDNTNTTLAEFVPYAALASAYNHELHIITLIADPLVAFQRNKHGAPYSSVYKQHLALQESIRDFPPWFPQQIFPA